MLVVSCTYTFMKQVETERTLLFSPLTEHGTALSQKFMYLYALWLAED